MNTTLLPDQPSLFLLSLGCPKNRVDSEVMLGSLLNEGYRLVGEAKDAEVILINSCAFIGEAKQETIDAILELARPKLRAKQKSKYYEARRARDAAKKEKPRLQDMSNLTLKSILRLGSSGGLTPL